MICLDSNSRSRGFCPASSWQGLVHDTYPVLSIYHRSAYLAARYRLGTVRILRHADCVWPLCSPYWQQSRYPRKGIPGLYAMTNVENEGWGTYIKFFGDVQCLANGGTAARNYIYYLMRKNGDQQHSLQQGRCAICCILDGFQWPGPPIKMLMDWLIG